MDWERIFARKDACDVENATKNCLLLTPPYSSIEVWLNFCDGKMSGSEEHCQKFETRWRLRVRTRAIMAAKSYKEIYGNKETFSNISIMSLRVFGARLETC